MSSSAIARHTSVRVVLLHCGVDVGSWSIDIPADLRAVDVLARMQLCAHRVGCTFALRDVPPDLRRLLDLVGMSDVFVDELW